MKKFNLKEIKIDGSTVLKVVVTGLTIATTLLTLKTDANDREEMKREILDELRKGC